MFGGKHPYEPERSDRTKVVRGLLTIVIGVGVPLLLFVWIWGNVVPRPDEQPPPPELGRATVAAPTRDLDGSWMLDADASWLGYRAREEIPRLRDTFDAVGRTDAVVGELTLEGTTLTEAWVEADLRELESDSEFRDRAIRPRYLESSTYPRARFHIVEPVPLLGPPEPGEPVRVSVPGELTIRETTRPITPWLRARWDGDAIRVIASITITLEDYGIRAPSIPGFRIVEEDSDIEMDLTFVPAD